MQFDGSIKSVAKGVSRRYLVHVRGLAARQSKHDGKERRRWTAIGSMI
jgi:hypothetical protein